LTKFYNTCVGTDNKLKMENADILFNLKTAKETVEEKARVAETMTREIEELEAQVKSLDQDVADLTADYTESQAANQKSMQEHVATQAILKKAIERMSFTYKSLMQAPGSEVVDVAATATDPGSAPAAYTNEGKTQQNKGGSKVVQLLTTVLEDSEKAARQLTQQMNDEQAKYTEDMRVAATSKKQANESIEAKTKRLVAAEKAGEVATDDYKAYSAAQAENLKSININNDLCQETVSGYKAKESELSTEIESVNSAINILKAQAGQNKQEEDHKEGQKQLSAK